LRKNYFLNSNHDNKAAVHSRTPDASRSRMMRYARGSVWSAVSLAPLFRTDLCALVSLWLKYGKTNAQFPDISIKIGFLFFVFDS
jgi:hypothetical protein